MQMNPYLSFQGGCEADFKSYKQCVEGQMGAIVRYGGSPLADEAPADWADKAMRGSVTVGGQVLMGADVAPDRYQKPHFVSLPLQRKSTTDAERIFSESAKGGTVVLPIEKRFCAVFLSMVDDRFGVPWLINGERSDAAPTDSQKWGRNEFD